MAALLQTTIGLDASLWLIWSGPQDVHPVQTLLLFTRFPLHARGGG